MKFAINYSPEAASLLQDNRIEIDLFKCPDWTDLVAEAQALRPVYIHFPIIAGQDVVASLDLDAIENWLKVTNTCFVNLHIAPLSVTTLPEAIEKVVADVRFITRRFGAENVIIENVPYPDPFHEDLPEVAANPQLLCQIVEETGCGFLLDVAHAALASDALKIDRHDYLSALPVAHIRELHVTGIGIRPDNGRREDHFGLSDSDWALLEWVMDRIRSGAWATPDVMAFEYGGIGPMFEWRSEESVIAKQVPRLVKMARSVG